MIEPKDYGFIAVVIVGFAAVNVVYLISYDTPSDDSLCQKLDGVMIGDTQNRSCVKDVDGKPVHVAPVDLPLAPDAAKCTAAGGTPLYDVRGLPCVKVVAGKPVHVRYEDLTRAQTKAQKTVVPESL
jgi:hypothetical protein